MNETSEKTLSSKNYKFVPSRNSAKNAKRSLEKSFYILKKYFRVELLHALRFGQIQINISIIFEKMV